MLKLRVLPTYAHAHMHAHAHAHAHVHTKLSIVSKNAVFAKYQQTQKIECAQHTHTQTHTHTPALSSERRLENSRQALVRAHQTVKGLCILDAIF